MKKQQLDHLLRAAGRITGAKRFIVIGSQSLHATRPDLSDAILRSVEADLIAGDKDDATEWLEAIGLLSQFHETFGYYADPVAEDTANLPKGWKSRLVPLSPGDTEGVIGMCLEPHDLAISKYFARRDKDRQFTRELARLRVVRKDRLFRLLEQTQMDEQRRSLIRQFIEADFAPQETSRE